MSEVPPFLFLNARQSGRLSDGGGVDACTGSEGMGGSGWRIWGVDGCRFWRDGGSWECSPGKTISFFISKSVWQVTLHVEDDLLHFHVIDFALVRFLENEKPSTIRQTPPDVKV